MAETPSRLADQITELIEPVLAQAGLDLEGLEHTRAGRRSMLRILVDRDGGIDLDKVAEVTRELSAVLDTTSVMGNNSYTLEVSSPGVERPLSAPRHWRRNVGRLVKVNLVEGEPVQGRIEAHDDTGVALRIGEELQRIDYDQIRRATVVIEFGKEGRHGH